MLTREKILFNPPELGCVLSLTGLPQSGSVILDRSPYGNNGTITGATWTQTEQGLWYLDLNSATPDYINCGTGSSLNIAGNLTILAWIKPTDVTTAARIASNGNYNNYGFELFLQSSELRFATYNTGVHPTSESTASLTTNTWQLVGVSLRGSTATLTRNGVNISDVQANHASIGSSSKPFVLGIYANDLSSGPLDGGIALVVVLNTNKSIPYIPSFYNETRHLFGV